MISVIIPVLNEDEGIQNYYEEMIKVLPGLSKEYELIFIDDGSTDTSLTLLQTLADKSKHIRVFSFKSNRGKADALAYGFSKAKGDIIVTMDADLQDKPSELHKFLKKHKEGVDVVCGWRKERKDTSKMVVISKFFNYLNRILFGLQIHDIDCGYKLFTSEAAKSLHIYGGLYRFIPLLLYQQGYIVDEVVVEHDVRHFGKSKYGFSKVWKNLPDLFTVIFLLKFAKRPLHFFGFVGGGLFALGVVIFMYLSFIWLGGESIGNRPLLLFSILLMLGGLQTLFTGFLADMMLHISHTNRQQSDYTSQFPLKYTTDKTN